MTNEQLVVLLTSYLERFAAATDQTRNMMPESMKERTQSILKMDIEAVPVLEPIYTLMGSMEKEIEFLKKQ